MIKLLKVCGAYNEYSGLSTDSLPIDDVPENSLLLLLDTNELLYFANDEWVEVGQSQSPSPLEPTPPSGAGGR